MEILILELSESKDYYWHVYSDNDGMDALGLFLRFVPVDWALNWAKDPGEVGIGTEETCVDLIDGKIKIYHSRSGDSQEEIDYCYEYAFTTTLEKFTEILEKWKEITIKKPHFVIIKHIGEDILFEEDYREEVEFDLSQAKLPEKVLKNICEPKIKNGLFYGGFHLKSDNEQIEMSNKLVADKNILSFDVKFEKDFTFNHAFFPADWDTNRLKRELLTELRNEAKVTQYLPEKKRNYFIIWELADDMTLMRVILDENLNIITCYPVFRKI